MMILILTLAANTLLILLTLYLARRRSYKSAEAPLAVTGESPVTGILSAFCLVVAYFLLYAKYADPTAAGEGPGSYWFIAGLSLASALLGCYNFLYIFVRKYLIFPDRLVLVDALGRLGEYTFREIRSAKVPMMSRSLRLQTDRGSVGIRSGNTQEYRKFLGALKDRLPRSSGGDVVENLYQSL